MGIVPQPEARAKSAPLFTKKTINPILLGLTPYAAQLLQHFRTQTALCYPAIIRINKRGKGMKKIFMNNKNTQGEREREMSMRILFMALLLVATQDVFAQAGRVIQRSFGGQPINLVIPSGYCVIGRNHPIGKLEYELQDHGNKGKSVVATLFADCKEWATRQVNPSYRIRHHGNYLFQMTKGQEWLVPSILTRKDMVDAMLAHELSSAGLGKTATQDAISKYMKDKLATSNQKTPESSNLNLGIIDSTDQAVFVGSQITLKYPTESPRVAGVMAMMLVSRVFVNLNLYADGVGISTFATLLAQQKKNAVALGAANP
jgi:hypothetical protein